MKDLEMVIAQKMTEKTGLNIGEDHVHVAGRRYYYIPEAKEGYPLFLHHYRSPFFLEIPYKDWQKMEEDVISVDDYIDSAFWSFGYYWGGGSMISGGYFTRLEEKNGIHDVKLIQRVMKAIRTKGSNVASGTQLSEEEKAEWKEVKEKYLKDTRVDFFYKADDFIKESFGCELRGFFSSDFLEKNQIFLSNNFIERNFRLVVSDELIREMLYNKKIPNPSEMEFFVGGGFEERRQVTSAEEFQQAIIQLGVIEAWEERERRIAERKARRNQETAHHPEENPEQSWFQKIFSFLK